MLEGVKKQHIKSYRGYHTHTRIYCAIILSKWDTSKVKNMRYMFYYSGYNSDTIVLNIEGWDTSKVTDMRYMFYYFGYNASYYLDISGWNVSSCRL